jgi:hypothetical protein
MGHNDEDTLNELFGALHEKLRESRKGDTDDDKAVLALRPTWAIVHAGGTSDDKMVVKKENLDLKLKVEAGSKVFFLHDGVPEFKNIFFGSVKKP